MDKKILFTDLDGTLLPMDEAKFEQICLTARREN